MCVLNNVINQWNTLFIAINAIIYTTCLWLPDVGEGAGLSWKFPILRDFTMADIIDLLYIQAKHKNRNT